ncbi:MAG: glycoside hydrolase family 31 protein [Acidobacteriales bacterium]|nr:glycoside hydrolase family 31 protein [Terriglobales bacterium]
MREWITRRDVLAGLALGASNLLFARSVNAAEVFGPLQGVPAVGNTHLLTLVAVSAKTLRLRVVQQGKHGLASEIGIVPRTWPEPLSLADTDAGHSTAIWGSHKIKIEERPWRISIEDDAGKLRQQLRFDPSTGAIHFEIAEGPLFGLGEGSHPLNRRGTLDSMRNGQHEPDLATYGTRVPIPWVIGATDTWGLFFAHPWGTFDLSGADGKFIPSESTPTRDIFLVLADTPAELMRECAELTGYPHMPPLWALGYQQSHRTLASRDEVLNEAKTFREKKLPCDAMIYLGTGFCPSGWNTGHGSFTFNPAVFPDPAAMFRQMHDEHLKVVLHVVSPPEDLHGEVGDTGEALKDPSDAAVYWPKHREVQRTGVDGWWPDEGDELVPASRLARNRMYWEGSQLFQPNVRPFALHRNGYAGIQRYGWMWSGDTRSTWKTLAGQIMDGINVGLCGMPYWGSDTGGFVPTKEFTAELFVRWFQFSSFCPSFRCHGRTWKLRLPWGWDLGSYEPSEFTSQFAADILPKPEDLHNTAVEGICRKYLNLRYQLLPYLYSMVAEAHATGLPLMRALWLAYPDDAKAVATDDAYLWGSNLLVAPVVEQGATHRATYLPRGVWWDYWNNARTEGGKEVTRDVDLETLPLYVKAGTILPIGPVKQYAQEESKEPLTLRIYPGADGTMSLYEDDGSSYDYQRGEFRRIECSWNNAEHTLTLKADTSGRLPITKVLSIEAVGNPGSKRITFSGKMISIRL